jgi:hypothetical protein
MPKVGDRVLAIASGENKVIRYYGAGVYEGDFPYGDTRSAVPMSRTERYEHDLDVLDHGGALHNPRIRLDNGKYVWGCECWWGPEAELRKRYDGCQLVEVDIEQDRKESNGGGVPQLMTVETPKEEHASS